MKTKQPQRMTQAQVVLAILASGNDVSHAEAFTFAGISRLAAVVAELRDDYSIRCDLVQFPGRLRSLGVLVKTAAGKFGRYSMPSELQRKSAQARLDAAGFRQERIAIARAYAALSQR